MEKVCDDIEFIIVDFCILVVKLIYVCWVISIYEVMEDKEVLIRKGFEKVGFV